MTNSVNENKSFETDVASGVQDQDAEISLLDLLQTIVDNLRLLFFGPSAVVATALTIGFFIPPTYTAKTQFLTPQQQQSSAASMLSSLGSLTGLASAVGGIKNPSDQYLSYLKSVTLQDTLIERFKLTERYDAKTKTDARITLASRVRYYYGKDGLISVEVDDKDPNFAAELANAHTDELSKLLAKLAITEAQQRRLFFENQLTVAKERLINAEIELKATGISSNILKMNPGSAIAVVAGLQASVTAQELKTEAMRGYLTESAPEFRQAMKELSSLREYLVKQEKDAMENNGKNTTQSNYITKYREYKYQEVLFELFSKQYEAAKLDEAREGAVVQVLDTAQPPEKKNKPISKLILMLMALIAFFIIIIYLVIKEYLRKTKNSIITQIFKNEPIL